jgi:hypothetical protein
MGDSYDQKEQKQDCSNIANLAKRNSGVANTSKISQPIYIERNGSSNLLSRTSLNPPELIESTKNREQKNDRNRDIMEMNESELDALLGLYSAEGLLEDIGSLETSIGEIILAKKSIDVKEVDHKEIKRVAATIRLIESIQKDGLLSADKLNEKGKKHSRSADNQKNNEVHVNVLDVRGASEETLNNSIMDRVESSLTTEGRGSLSVAIERQNDKKITDVFKHENDIELTDAENKEVDDSMRKREIPKEYRNILAKDKKREIANKQNETVNYEEFSRRTQNTIMAVIPSPSEKVATLGEANNDYEATFEGEILPGKDGFTKLLVPEWLQQYQGLVRMQEGIDLNFVGSKEVTVRYYLAKGGGNVDVKVNAPDYSDEIKKELTKFKVLATHILKIPE